MIRGRIALIPGLLLLLISCEAKASCGFTEAASSPVVVYGREDAARSILSLGLAGEYPFIVFTHLQDTEALEELLSKGRGRIVLANGAEAGNIAWQSTHLFYVNGEEKEGAGRFERGFSVAPGEYLVRAAAGTEGGADAVLRLDAKALRLKDGCLEKRIALSGGRHAISIEGAGWFEAAVIKKAEEGAETLPWISFRRINPTRYIANVSGASGPFTIVLGVAYNRNWKAFIRGGENESESASALLGRWMEKRSEAGAHLLVNGYANGWVIEPRAADFQMVIEYEPQQYIEAGLAVSAAAFAISGIVLVIKGRKRG